MGLRIVGLRIVALWIVGLRNLSLRILGVRIGTLDNAQLKIFEKIKFFNEYTFSG